MDEVIRNLDDSKCPGPDGINGIIMKSLHKCLPKFLISLFNKCLVLGCFPKEWKKTRVIAIPKSDKTKLHSIQGYRGISLLSIPGKCLEKLVIVSLNYFLETTGQIPSLQYGFTAGRSTADAIKTVLEFVEHSRKLSPGTGHSGGVQQRLAPRNSSTALETKMSPKHLQHGEGLFMRPHDPRYIREFL